MLGNGFDLYHNLLTHYNDFMTIGEYLCKKHRTINYDNLDNITIYSELEDLANKTIQEKIFTYEDAYKEAEIYKEEYAVFLGNLHTNCWFNYFLDIKNRNGWVDLENQIEKAKQRKVWLNCGGFITIDKTEALTAIDVNTGKYIGKKDLNDTIFTVNKEATIEIAKQLKLRDIGGIIIIDYIDMNEENRKKVLEIFKNCIKEDRSKVQIVGFTPLNLLELTRKHMWS